jgi:hypothetical protein
MERNGLKSTGGSCPSGPGHPSHQLCVSADFSFWEDFLLLLLLLLLPLSFVCFCTEE